MAYCARRKDAQQLHLQTQQVADLVETQVPPSAKAKTSLLPALRAGEAPFSCPNSSDSSNASGIAPQSRATNGRATLTIDLLRQWVPDGPIRT